MDFASTRDAALARLDDFVGIAPRYGRERNFVKPGHPAVSRLSPAIRHRLISEQEVARRVMAAHPFHAVEKFVQEVYWRTYWKSWLSLRPQIWTDFSQRPIPDPPLARQVEAGHSGNAIIDHFARELRETGYLHNHARMWVAAWWIHQARLPWQSGARWFFRHLLDADPASNTLSWRWVAGLQTPGKTYLARRSNLETYLDADWLEPYRSGLAEFENPEPFLPSSPTREPVTEVDLPAMDLDPMLRTGLWIHEEDLSVETLAWENMPIAAARVIADAASWDRWEVSGGRRAWLEAALQDSAKRASQNWNRPVVMETRQSIETSLLHWAEEEGLEQVVLMRPAPGPLADTWERLHPRLVAAGLRVALRDRPEDLAFRPLARAGFFGFWEKVRSRLLAPG